VAAIVGKPVQNLIKVSIDDCSRFALSSLSMAHRMQYWRPEVANCSVGALDHSGSDQFKRNIAARGDTLWIVSVVEGRLTLLGSFEIEKFISYATARKRFGKKNVWEAMNAVAVSGSVRDVEKIDIDDLLDRLEFVTHAGTSRLVRPHSPSRLGLQLQRIRKLTEGSAMLLAERMSVSPSGFKERHGDSGKNWQDEELLNGLISAEAEFEEGAVLYRAHLTRERNRELIRQVKREAMRKYGRLACIVCGFDFAHAYGVAGRNYIECHHTAPIHQMKPGDKTNRRDVVLLCANCHRMIHRSRPWLSLIELRAILVPTNLRGAEKT
jgi:hypothetical protein